MTDFQLELIGLLLVGTLAIPLLLLRSGATPTASTAAAATTAATMIIILSRGDFSHHD